MIRRTFKCPAIYRLTLKKDDDALSAENGRNFALKVVPHVLKCGNFNTDIQQYRYCKINKFMFKWRASIVSLSLFKPGATRKDDVLSAINNINGDLDLAFNWNLDTTIQKTATGVMCNPTMRKLRIGSKRGLYFTYTPPMTVRRFYDSAGLAAKAPYADDGIGQYLTNVCGIADFRAPDEWRGGCLQWWDLPTLVQIEDTAPVLINLYVDTYVNVTLRGRK